MKNSAINRTCAVLVLILAASSAWATVDQERDEINKSFTLPARARVDVLAINGSVDIRAVDGDTALVQLERTGRNRAELDCNNIVVEQTGGTLVIQSENTGGPGCQVIQVRHRLLLSLPRHVALRIRGVSGPINIGEIEGALRISGNSGNINLAQPSRDSSISGNSGDLTVNLRRLGAEGLELSGHSGAIKLHLSDELNAVVRVSGISGSVSSELPDVQFQKVGASDYYARIGSGGPTINLAGNSGRILLGRYQE